MSEQNMNVDDGLDDELRKWMHSVRSGRDRWRGQGVNQRRRRSRLNERMTGMNARDRGNAQRKESAARLIAALEAKHHALNIERMRAEQARQNSQSTERSQQQLSAEEIRRQATSTQQRDAAPALKPSQVAQAHVDAHRDQLIALGVSAAAVDGMIGQYEQQLEQARRDALTTEMSANATEQELSQDREIGAEATITSEGRHHAGFIDLSLVQDYTAESLDQIDDLEAGQDPTVGELISDSGVENGAPINGASDEAEPSNVIDLDVARNAARSVDEGAQV